MPIQADWIALVRHGATSIDPETPPHLWKLSNEGRDAVGELAKQLEGWRASAVVCSPEPKARETAQLIAAHDNIRIDEDLREQGLGQIPFLSAEAFDKAITQFFDTPDVAVLGSESASAAAQRMDRTLRRIERAPAIVVSHGRIISAYVSALLGVHGLEIWRALKMPDVLLVHPTTRRVSPLATPSRQCP